MTDTSSNWWRRRIPMVVGLAVVVVAIVWAYWTTPSASFHLNQNNVSEWLGWFGLVGLVIAIMQLMMTESTARVSAVAVQLAMLRLEALDVALEVTSATEAMANAADLFAKEDFTGGLGSCIRAMEMLAHVSPDHARLPTVAREQLKGIRDQVMSAASAARRGARGELNRTDIDNLIDTVQIQRRELIALSSSLKWNPQEMSK